MLNLFNKNKEESPTKKLQKHFSDRYLKTVELVQAGIIVEEDVNLLIKNEQTVSYVIQQIKSESKENERKKAYKAIVNRDELLIDEQIKKVEDERTLHYNEFSKLMFTEPVDAPSAMEKQSQLNFISNNIKSCDIILKDLQECKESHFKVKRGRPPKQEEKNIFELAREVKEVDDNGLSIDDRIILLLKQLPAEKKPYLLEYIKQMINAEESLKTINH